MTKRKPISLRVRFNIFKRDSFTCQYCGKTPPSTVLEVDHLIPVSKGGENIDDNLITSCFDCNRGKSDINLTELPQTTAQKLESIKERELQYKEYQKLLLSIDSRVNREVEVVNDKFKVYFPGNIFTERFKTSVKKFIDKLGLVCVLGCLDLACTRIYDAEKATSYFCGICWNKIKNN